MANVSIGMDFGTTYTYIGFVHGTEGNGEMHVEALIPAAAQTNGIPSLYYRDENRELIGVQAVNPAAMKPANAIASVKKRLGETSIPFGPAGSYSVTPAEVVKKLMTYALENADQILRESFAIKPDLFDIVLTVPVDFDAAQHRMLRQILEGIRLQNGIGVRYVTVVQEPVASAVRFLGVRNDPDEYAVVFDLGGGTLDIAVVHDEPNGDSPYRVVDQGGDRSLGGNDWDDRMAEILKRKFREATGRDPGSRTLLKLPNLARQLKESLSVVETDICDIDHEGDTVTITVTRAEFEAETRDLLERAIQQLQTVLNRQKALRIRYLILTGGSCYMPQITRALEAPGILPAGTEVRIFRPERSVAEGASILSHLLGARWVQPDPSNAGKDDPGSADRKKPQPAVQPVQQIAPHGYGILATVPERENEQMIWLFFTKGAKLPLDVRMDAATIQPREKGSVQHVMYTIFETDVMKEGTDPYAPDTYITINGRQYTSTVNGREVYDAYLEFERPLTSRIQLEQLLSMDSSLDLRFSAAAMDGKARLETVVRLSGKSVSEP